VGIVACLLLRVTVQGSIQRVVIVLSLCSMMNVFAVVKIVT